MDPDPNPDPPDSRVFGPLDPDPSILLSILFCDFFLTFYLRKMMQMYLQKVICRKTFFKLVFCWLIKIAGSGSASGSISQRHGSADPDPDPHQNVMDPLLWCFSDTGFLLFVVYTTCAMILHWVPGVKAVREGFILYSSNESILKNWINYLSQGVKNPTKNVY